MVVVEGLHQPGRVPKFWSLSTKRQEHEDMTITIKAGPTKQDHSMDCHFLRWPRQFCRMWVSAFGIYKLLGLTSYVGVPSKWVWNMKAKWVEACRSVGLEKSHILGSAQAFGPNVDRDLNFLPSPALSLGALICLLSKWGGAVPLSRKAVSGREIRRRLRSACWMVC